MHEHQGGGEPVDEVVLLQVATAVGDVSGHVEQLQHGQGGGLALHTAHTHRISRTIGHDA